MDSCIKRNSIFQLIKECLGMRCEPRLLIPGDVYFVYKRVFGYPKAKNKAAWYVLVGIHPLAEYSGSIKYLAVENKGRIYKFVSQEFFTEVLLSPFAEPNT